MFPSARRPEIDGLRAFAVLPVLIAHAWPEILPGGHLGVDVFFVLSGYLITGLLLAGMEAGSFSFKEFYRRRMLRLMPAFFLVLFVTFGMSWVIHTAEETRTTVLTGIFAAISASNFFLPTTGGYFSADANTNPLLHTWSLAVEEQFYLVFPLVLLLFMRRAPARLELVLTLVAGVSLAYALYLEAIHSPWAHYSSPARAWELLVGVLLAIQMRRRATADPVKAMPAAKVVAWLGVLLLTAAYLVDMSDRDVLARVLTCTATIGIIWGLHVGAGRLTVLLRMRVFVYIGLISYSLYLWHQPVMAFGRLVFPASSLSFLFGTFSLSLILSVLTYHLIEAPVRSSKASMMRVMWSFLVALILVVSFTASSVKTDYFAARDVGSPTLAIKNHPDTDQVRKCMFWGFHPTKPDDFCLLEATVAERGTAPVVAIWGDSHAGSLIYGFKSLTRPYDILHLGMSGCLLDLSGRIASKNSQTCDAKHLFALERIISDPDVHVVILHAKSKIFDVANGPVMAEDLTFAMDAVANAGKAVILVTPVPIYDLSIPEAMLRSQRSGIDFVPSIPVSEHLEDPSRLIYPAIEAATERGIPIVYAESVFCENGTCTPSLGDLPLYQDDDHLGVLGARMLAIEIDPVIRDMLDLPLYPDHRVEMERDLMGGVPSQ